MFPILKNVVAILVAIWAGSWASRGFETIGLTLPAYIGAMLVAAVLRNSDDATGSMGFRRVSSMTSAVALSLILVVALMTLELSELSGLALPWWQSFSSLAVFAAAGPVYRIMGRS